jgi:DNA-binding XRE family transcriptional regulator
LRYAKQQDKPRPVSYPRDPTTIGEHIRKKRMDLRLLQNDVASIIKVTEDCITLWEKNHSVPQINYFPRIINFLGYCPLEFDETTLSGRLKAYRWRNGFSNKKLGRLLKVNGSTILAWKNEKSIPKQEHLLELEALSAYSGRLDQAIS